MSTPSKRERWRTRVKITLVFVALVLDLNGYPSTGIEGTAKVGPRPPGHDHPQPGLSRRDE